MGLFILSSATSSFGQIETDGTLGPALSIPGDDVRISASLGKRVGSNLFHSFKQFNVSPFAAVAFEAPEEAVDISNVLVRVTGNQPSRIDGTLSSEVPGANFYLINPAGVVFGSTALINVPGSFVVSTASFVELANGGRFDAVDPGQSVLTTAAPSAFGFLNDSVKPVVFAKTVPDLDLGILLFDRGAVSVVAGDISLTATQISTFDGNVNLVSVASPGRVTLDGSDPNASPSLDGVGRLGTIRANASRTTPGGANSKAVIRAGSLILENGSEWVAGGAGADVDVTGVADVSAGARIVTAPRLDLDGNPIASGDVTVRAGTLVLRDGGRIESQAGDGIAGGAVHVRADGELRVVTGGQIRSTVMSAGEDPGEPDGEGDDSGVDEPVEIPPAVAGGAIDVTAADIRLDGVGAPADSDGPTGVLSIARDTGTGGSIVVRASTLDVRNTARVDAGTFGVGRGGDIDVETTGPIRVDGAGLGVAEQQTAIIAGAAPGSTGAVGNVRVDAPLLEIFNAGRVASIASGAGAGGDVTVTGRDVVVDGNGFDGFTGVLTETTDAGAGGRLTLDAESSVVVTRAGGISANTSGGGNAGSVSVTATRVRLDGRGVPFSTGIDAINRGTVANGSGTGGAITIAASDVLEILDGAGVRTNTSGAGNAGTIDIDAARLLVDRAGSALNTGIGAQVEATGTGDGGEINVYADDVTVLNGGRISVTTVGAGNAGRLELNGGNVTLNAGGLIESSSEYDPPGQNTGAPLGRGGDLTVRSARDVTVRNDSRISARSEANDAGSIRVLLPGTLTLEAGGRITTEADRAGGNIEIGVPPETALKAAVAARSRAASVGAAGVDEIGDFSPAYVILRNEGQIKADANLGAGGNVTVSAGVVVADTAADQAITASSQLSTPGRIDISGQLVDIAGDLVRLRSELADPQARLVDACAARLGGRDAAPSSFVATGRGGSPLTAGGFSPALTIVMPRDGGGGR